MMYIVKMFTVVNINKILSQVLWFNPTNNAKWTIISFKWQNWRKTIQYYVYEILARRRDQTTNNCNLARSHNSFTFSSKLVLESYTDRVKKGALSNNEKIWNFNACFNFAFNMCVFLNVGDGVARRNHVISSPICPQAEGVDQDFAVNGNIPKTCFYFHM